MLPVLDWILHNLEVWLRAATAPGTMRCSGVLQEQPARGAPVQPAIAEPVPGPVQLEVERNSRRRSREAQIIEAFQDAECAK